MWQRGHGEPGMCDSKPRDLFCEDDACGLDGLTLSPGLCPAAGAFYAFPKDQLVDLAHDWHLDRMRS
jgi:hypothetical protein